MAYVDISAIKSLRWKLKMVDQKGKEVDCASYLLKRGVSHNDVDDIINDPNGMWDNYLERCGHKIWQ